MTHSNFESFVHQYVLSPAPWIGFDPLAQLLPSGSTKTSKELPIGLPTSPTNDTLVGVRAVLAARSVAYSLPQEARLRLRVSDMLKQSFLRDGFVIMRSIVTTGLIEKALNKVKTAMANGKFEVNQQKKYFGSEQGMMKFGPHVCASVMLTNVLFKSGIVDIVEQILGVGNIVLRDYSAEVLYTPCSEVHQQEGRDPLELRGRAAWEIGLVIRAFKMLGLDHLVRVAVPLTPGLSVDENRGQILAWPGMRYSLFTTFQLSLHFLIGVCILIFPICIFDAVYTGSHLKIHPAVSKIVEEVCFSALVLKTFPFVQVADCTKRNANVASLTDRPLA